MKRFYAAILLAVVIAPDIAEAGWLWRSHSYHHWNAYYRQSWRNRHH